MQIPIRIYGDPVLRQKTEPLTKDYPKLKELIDNMYETMYGAAGVGLAAPQIGLALRIFVVDASPFAEDEDYAHQADLLRDFRKVFINPKILNESGEQWKFAEGCLSIPGIRESVARKPVIKMEYYDQDWNHHQIELDGLAARIVQHEYDHLEGTLFTDYLVGLKKKLTQNKLNKMAKGQVHADYPIRLAK